MRLTTSGAVVVGIFIAIIIFSIGRTIKLVRHRIQVNRMQKSGELLVEGSLQRDNMPNIISVAVLAVILCYMLSRRSFFIMNPLMTVAFILYVLDNIAEIVLFVLNILHGEDCYLTSHGLVCFNMSVEWTDCRCAWEAPATEGAITNTLYVYKHESKVPIIVRFNYKYDEAHKVIDRYALGVRYNGYMESEEWEQRPKFTGGSTEKNVL